MMRFLRSGMVSLIVIILAMVSMSCDPEKEGSGTTESVVDFTSHNTNAAFFVDNHSSHNLVLFKGSLAPGNLLGGIPAGDEYHGIKKNLSLFTKTEAFPLIVITEDQYTENRNNLSVLTNTPFTRVYVFYNHGLDNPARYAVSGRVGGRHRL